MKKWIGWMLALLCVLALTACSPAVSMDGPPPNAWGNAPDFVVLDADGNAVRLSDFCGKPIVVNFWATWCGFCVKEMPDFDRAYTENPDVVFLMVNVTDGVYETVKKAQAFVDEKGFSFDVYFDTSAMAVKAYGIDGYPTTLFINCEGDLVDKQEGMIDYDTLMQGIAGIRGNAQ